VLTVNLDFLGPLQPLDLNHALYFPLRDHDHQRPICEKVIYGRYGVTISWKSLPL